MKRALVLLFALLLAAVSIAQVAPQIPRSPTRWVTDTAGFLSEPTRRALDARLEDYERSSGHQVLVWVGKTTGATPLEDWTVRAFAAWRVGRKGLDDGLVLFVFAQDRRVRLEVGYGLEERVPDALAARILRESILPRIQTGDRDGAITAGIDRLIETLGSDGTAPDAAREQPLGRLQILLLAVAGMVLVGVAIRYPRQTLYLLMLLARSGRGGGGGNSRGGGGFGGGGGRSGGGGASGKW